MPGTAAEWDEKHRRAEREASQEVSPFVRELLPLLPAGPALDLACGRGRHTLLLAERGQPVTAVDWSPVAVELLGQSARAKGLRFERLPDGQVKIVPAKSGILGICRDLRDASLLEGAFALVLCVHYLDRALMLAMEKALRPGGMLLFETCTTAQLAFEGGPRNPAYLLEPGELRTSFPGLEIVFYRELRAGQGIASLLGRKPAKPNCELCGAGRNITAS